MSSTSKTPAALAPSHQVADQLRQYIRSGDYHIGQQLENEHTLAKNFGVNRTTIRKALKILQEERIISRQQGHGTFVTNPTYAQTLGAKVSLLGAMVWDKEYYFGTILNSVFSRAAARGYVLTTVLSTPESEFQSIDTFIKSGVKGLILTPKNTSIDTYKKLQKENIPVVLLDSLLPAVNEDFVSVNDRQGTYIAAEHLIGLGHTKLGYVGNHDTNDIPCQPDRLEGFRNACIHHHLEIRPEWHIEGDSNNADDYMPKLRRVIGQSNRPTAFVCFSDIWALRVIQVAREFGLRVPDDLSVTGFDNSEQSRNTDVPLTTISPEPDEMGVLLTDLLIEKIEKPQPRPKRTILVTPQLIMRKSTAKPSI